MNYALRRLWSNHWLLLSLVLVLIAAGCATKATTKPVEVEEQPTTSEGVIHEVTVSEEEGAVLVAVKANQQLTYSAIKHLFPLGVVLYFPNTSLEGVQETYTPESTLIKSIVTSQPTEEEKRSRIQINLEDDVRYEVSQEENQLMVHFTKPMAEEVMAEATAAGESEEPAGEEAVTPAPEEVSEPASMEPEEEQASVPMPAEAGVAGEPAWINRINFVMMEQDKSRVIVGTTGPVQYETERPSPKRVLLKLYNTKIPKFEKRPLITTRFQSAVDRVLPIQTAKMGDTALIAIELREAVPYRVEQQDNVVFVDFEPSTVPPRPMPDVEMPKWQQVMRDSEAAVIKEKEEEVSAAEDVSDEDEKVYTGQEISLDFQDADIRNVFRILHEISGKNFVIGDNVKGRVTLKLDRVPWDQALDLITRMNNLGTVVEGNIVRIAPLATITAEKAAEKSAKEAQEEAEDTVTEYIPINYSEAGDMQEHLTEVLTERGKISLDERTNTIIITDVQESIDDAKEIVKRLDIVTPQVMIEARIVEATRDFSREFGIAWGGDYSDSLQQNSGDAIVSSFGGAIVDVPIPAPTGAIGLSVGKVGGYAWNLDVVLEAMETQGEVKIISCPRTVTLDHKTAKISQGLEYPYNKLDESGNTVTEWKKVELMLEVEPHVTPDNRIRMKIDTKKSDLGATIGGNISFIIKETQTELMVNDGDTLVIGGITRTRQDTNSEGIPGLSKIPVLGWLFKNSQKADLREELLIFITPKIIRLPETSQI
jgi:type IV pilus assembly protein PilQ